MHDDETRPLRPGAGAGGSISTGAASVGAGGWPVIAGYRVVRQISGGVMGEVYEAEKEMGPAGTMPVVLKVMSAYASTPERRSQFVSEAQTIVGLQAIPGIAKVFDVGLYREGSEQRPYIAMEMIPGERTLERYARASGPSRRELIGLVRSVCHALHKVHERGVLHLDLKPSNIMVDPDGRPVVIDFGISVSARGPVEGGGVQGTLEYMSPEQAGGAGACDRRSDVYSLGVILHEVLTGRRPYRVERGDYRRVVETIRTAGPARRAPVVGGERISAGLWRIVRRAMAKDADERFPSARALGEALDGWLRRTALAADRPGPMGAACGAAAVLISLVLSAWPAVWLIDGVTGLAGAYEERVAGLLPAVQPQGPFEHVRVVGFDDGTDFEALASSLGIEGVRNDVGASRRPVLGAMLDRLRVSGASCVAFDLAFYSSERTLGVLRATCGPCAASYQELMTSGAVDRWDEEFGSAMARSRGAGVPVVIAAEWSRDAQTGLPGQLSAALAVACGRWGGYTASRDWVIDLAVDQGDDRPDVLFSLGFEAMAAAVDGGAYPRGRLDRARGELHYWIESASGLGLIHRGAVVSRGVVRLSDVLVNDRRDLEEEEGIRVGAAVGRLHLSGFPPREVLDATTVRLEEVFEASEDRLRRLFAGRVVMVGNLRSDAPDLHAHPVLGSLHGVYGHALTVEQLSGSPYLRVPTPAQSAWLLLAAAAPVGVVFGVPGLGRRRLLGLSAAWAAVWGAAAVLSAVFLLFLIDPWVQMTAVVLAASAGLGLRTVLVDRVRALNAPAVSVA